MRFGSDLQQLKPLAYERRSGGLTRGAGGRVIESISLSPTWSMSGKTSLHSHVLRRESSNTRTGQGTPRPAQPRTPPFIRSSRRIPNLTARHTWSWGWGLRQHRSVRVGEGRGETDGLDPSRSGWPFCGMATLALRVLPSRCQSILA